jgi:hypothetical protein
MSLGGRGRKLGHKVGRDRSEWGGSYQLMLSSILWCSLLKLVKYALYQLQKHRNLHLCKLQMPHGDDL